MFHVKHLSQCSAISEQNVSRETFGNPETFRLRTAQTPRLSTAKKWDVPASREGGGQRRTGGGGQRRARGARTVNTAVGLARGGCGQRRVREACARTINVALASRAGDGSGPQLRAAGGCARRRGRAHVASGALRDRRFGPPSASSGTPPFASQQACRRRARRARSGCRAAKRTGRRVRPP